MKVPANENDAGRHFDVELLIIHPSLAPAEITDALGLTGHFVHPVGERRQTPKGTLLPGRYKDTRWRHSIRYTTENQHFVWAVADLVETLKPSKTFLRSLRDTGGEAQIIVQFLGDGYFGDTIPGEILSVIAELGLDFGIECFVLPQS